MFKRFKTGKSKRRKLLAVFLSFFVFETLTALLTPVLGQASGAFIVIPVCIASWMVGWLAGAVVSLIGMTINMVIFELFGNLTFTSMLINTIVLIGISLLIGWLRKTTYQEHQLSKELQRKNELLAHLLSDTEDFSSALVAQTTGLHKILNSAKVMTAAVDFEETVMTIAKEIATSIDASGCTVSSWDRASDTVITLIDYRIEDQDLFDNRGTVYQLNEYPTTQRVLEQGKIITVYQNDPNDDHTEVEYMKQQNSFSLLLMPIKYEGEVIGLVEIDDIEDRKFTEEDINTAQKMVELAGTTFHNARIFDEIQYRLQEQTLLAKAVSTITTSLDRNVTLQLLCEQLCIALNATSVYVCTIEETTKLSTVIAEYYSPHATTNEKNSDLGETYPDDDFRFFEFLVTGLPFTNQLDAPDLGSLEKEHMSKYDAKTILYLPIRMKGMAKGYIEVWDSRQKRYFSEREINLGKALAEHTSIALENAYLHNQIVEAESRFRSIAENSPDHVMVLDKELLIRYVNHPSPGLTIDQLLGTPLYSYVAKDEQKRVKDILQRALETNKPDTYETEYLGANQELIYYESRVSPLVSEGKISGLVVNSRDISHRKEMEKKLEYLALHDPLTGLPNRRFLELRLEEIIKLVSRQKLRLEIAILDLDNFKEINDTFGHTVGDQVLIELGKRLKEHVRGSDFPARFGGDEFIVLFVDNLDIPEKRFHERFESIFSTPILVDDHEIFVNASIGYSSHCGKEKIDGEMIIKQADDAMYRLKATKKAKRDG